MLRPTAIKVNPLEIYIIQVQFDNGEIKLFDVKPYIKGAWYGELKEKSYFSTVHTDGFTVAWANGQDICPDDLYYLSKPVDFDV